MFRHKKLPKQKVAEEKIYKKAKIAPFHRNPFYQMQDKTAVSLTIDYAKHKNEIVIFELQNIAHSVLNDYTLKSNDPNAIKKERIKLLQLLLPPNSTFVDRYDFYSFDTPFDEIFNLFKLKWREVKKEYDDPPLNLALGMLEYQLLKYDFSANPQKMYHTAYRPDYVFRELTRNKVMQRLWLNSIREFQKFLPEKVMILSPQDFKKIGMLTKKIIDCFGLHKKIFLKGSYGAENRANQYVKIINSTHLSNKLLAFKPILKKSKFCLVESASQMGKSKEKKTFSTYRALCTLIHDRDGEDDYRIINRWRSVSKKYLNSHQHEQTDYFDKWKSTSVIQESKDKFAHLPLSPEKAIKHLSLDKNKPELFNSFKLLLTRLIAIDFARVLNATPVWSKKHNDKKVFYLSKKTKSLITEKNLRVFATCIKKQNTLNQLLTPYIDQSKLLAERDWYLITSVVVMLLMKLKPNNVRENSDKINNLIFEVDSDKAHKKAEKLMNHYKRCGFYALSANHQLLEKMTPKKMPAKRGLK